MYGFPSHPTKALCRGTPLPLCETHAFIKDVANSVSSFLHWGTVSFQSRGGSQGISVRARRTMEAGLSWAPLGCPGGEREPRMLSTFKSSVSPGSRPSQELGSQFLVLRTGAGLLCLQLHAFYGTGNVV